MLARLVLAIPFLVACGANSTGIEPVECPPDSTLTYENFGRQLMDTHCNDCHDRESPRLTTQASIQANIGAILDEAVYTDAMPEDGPMPLLAREQLNEWLACGAP